MRSWLKSVLVAILLLSAPAFAEEQHGPALWKISNASTNLYILGSVHVLKAGTPWLTDDLSRKISAAGAIYLEISAAEQQPQAMSELLKKYGYLPPGDSLKKHLPDEVYADLVAALSRFGMSEKVYNSFKPWTADVIYADYKFVKAGYNPANGVEATIIGLAAAKGIPVEGLETADSQIAMLDSLTEQEVADMLRGELVDEGGMAVMDRLTRSWLSGDVADLTAYFAETAKDSPSLQKRIFADRNAAWVPKIQAIMAKPGSYVLIVGTGHLVGPESVISLLQKAGIKVDRVN